MAQTYTLEEAAQRLGLPPEDFKRRLKTEWTSVRSFRDGATLRFRSADIDELARTLGQASDPELQLGPPGGMPVTSTDEFLLPEDLPAAHGHEDAVGSDDIFALTAGDSGRARPKAPGDSDVRLELDAGPKAGSEPDLSLRTEEMNLDLSGPASGKAKRPGGLSSGKLTAPPPSGSKLVKRDDANAIPGPPSSEGPASQDSSSEFELSLDADSDSFELQLTNDDGSEEVDLGDLPSTAGPGGRSGVNLGKPSDSGVSLERKPTPADDSDDFELSLEPDAAPPPPSSGRLSQKRNAAPIPPADADSDSEFELTLDDNSGVTDAVAEEVAGEKGDIFETDFELPAVGGDADSGSEVVAVESSDTDLENSDFDIALDESDIQAEDESGSQVVLLDDEPQPTAGGASGRAAAAAAGAVAGAAAAAAVSGRRRRPAVDDVEVEDDDAAGALRGVRRGEDADEELVPARGRPLTWGPLPAAVLIPTLILTFLGTVMSYESLRGMWAYHHGTQPSGSLVRSIAGLFDADPK
jgi:hypothetical protein